MLVRAAELMVLRQLGQAHGSVDVISIVLSQSNGQLLDHIWMIRCDVVGLIGVSDDVE